MVTVTKEPAIHDSDMFHRVGTCDVLYQELGDIPKTMISTRVDQTDFLIMGQRVPVYEVDNTIVGNIRIVNYSPRDFWIVYSNNERFLLRGRSGRSMGAAYDHLCIMRRIVKGPIYEDQSRAEEDYSSYSRLSGKSQMEITGSSDPSQTTFTKMFIAGKALGMPTLVREHGVFIVPANQPGAENVTYPDLDQEYRMILHRLTDRIRDRSCSLVNVIINDPCGIFSTQAYVWHGSVSKITVIRAVRLPSVVITRLDDEGMQVTSTYPLVKDEHNASGRGVYVFGDVVISRDRLNLDCYLASDECPEELFGPSKYRVREVERKNKQLEDELIALREQVKHLESDKKRLTEALKSHPAAREYVEEQNQAEREHETAKMRHEREQRELLAAMKAEEDKRRIEDDNARREFEREKMEHERERAQREAIHKRQMEELKIKEAKTERRFKVVDLVIKLGLSVLAAGMAILKLLPKSKENNMVPI